MNNFTYSDELYHHGVKGQRWGVRRYQNYDGTLTDAGRKKNRQFTRTGKAKKSSGMKSINPLLGRKITANKEQRIERGRVLAEDQNRTEAGALARSVGRSIANGAAAGVITAAGTVAVASLASLPVAGVAAPFILAGAATGLKVAAISNMIRTAQDVGDIAMYRGRKYGKI